MDHIEEDLTGITYVPPSVTSLVDCMRYELQVIENQFQQLQAEVDDTENEDERQRQKRLRVIYQLEDALDDGFLRAVLPFSGGSL